MSISFAVSYIVKGNAPKEYIKKGRYRLNNKSEKSHHCATCSGNDQISHTRHCSIPCRSNTGCQRQRAYVNRSATNRPCKNPSPCNINNGFLSDDTPIAMVYSPVQQWRDLYDPHTGLTQGTIFKELDLPFYPTPCNNKETRSCGCI